jgi:hypothetical protein
VSVRDFTCTETRIWRVLKDGEPHTQDELKGAVDPDYPELCTLKNVANHLSNMRKKLPTGTVIITRLVNTRSCRYQALRKLYSANDGIH